MFAVIFDTSSSLENLTSFSKRFICSRRSSFSFVRSLTFSSASVCFTFLFLRDSRHAWLFRSRFLLYEVVRTSFGGEGTLSVKSTTWSASAILVSSTWLRICDSWFCKTTKLEAYFFFRLRGRHSRSRYFSICLLIWHDRFFSNMLLTSTVLIIYSLLLTNINDAY